MPIMRTVWLPLRLFPYAMLELAEDGIENSE